jgi:hypothetical protein
MSVPAARLSWDSTALLDALTAQTAVLLPPHSASLMQLTHNLLLFTCFNGHPHQCILFLMCVNHGLKGQDAAYQLVQISAPIVQGPAAPVQVTAPPTAVAAPAPTQLPSPARRCDCRCCMGESGPCCCFSPPASCAGSRPSLRYDFSTSIWYARNNCSAYSNCRRAGGRRAGGQAGWSAQRVSEAHSRLARRAAAFNCIAPNKHPLLAAPAPAPPTLPAHLLQQPGTAAAHVQAGRRVCLPAPWQLQLKVGQRQQDRGTAVPDCLQLLRRLICQHSVVGGPRLKRQSCPLPHSVGCNTALGDLALNLTPPALLCRQNIQGLDLQGAQ